MGVIESTYTEIIKQEMPKSLYSTLKSSHIDLNPHQVEADVFALSTI